MRYQEWSFHLRKTKIVEAILVELLNRNPLHPALRNKLGGRASSWRHMMWINNQKISLVIERTGAKDTLQVQNIDNCVDRPTFDEASLSPPIMIGHPRINHNYLQEHDCSINLCLWNAARSGQRQRKALLILHEESFNNGMRLDWESSQHLHGTSQRESIVMETSTLPIQSLLPTKFAGLSPTLRCVIQGTQL